MIGICLITLLAIYAVLMTGLHENAEITECAPPLPPTKDAYDV